MNIFRVLLLGLLLASGPARASADFSAGSLYRTAGVPAWSAQAGTFTIMLWVYAPSASGMNNFFSADDGGAFRVYVNLGTAADSPTEPYFLTRNGEWHFNRDGSYTANPARSFDVSLGWTFLAVSFTQGGATDLYAWQAGVNQDALVHVPVQDRGSSIAGSGAVNTFMLGDESNFVEGCRCLMGPVYVYDGIALSQTQIDAQRQQLAPLVTGHLIAYSTFLDSAALAADESGTADWSVHGAVRLSGDDPPPAAAGGGESTGGESAGGATTGASAGGSTAGSGGGAATGGAGGALAADALLILLGIGALRRRLRR